MVATVGLVLVVVMRRVPKLSVAVALQISNAGCPNGEAADMPSPTLAIRASNTSKQATQAAIRPPDHRARINARMPGMTETIT